MNLVYLAIIWLLAVNCGSSNTNSGANSFALTLDQQSQTMTVVDSQAQSTGNGIRLIFSSITDGASSLAVDSNEQQLSIHIINIQTIDLGLSYAVGSGNDSILVDIDGLHFIATSGEIIFSEISNISNQSVTGQFDLGFVSTDISNPHSLTIVGDFNLVVP